MESQTTGNTGTDKMPLIVCILFTALIIICGIETVTVIRSARNPYCAQPETNSSPTHAKPIVQRYVEFSHQQ